MPVARDARRTPVVESYKLSEPETVAAAKRRSNTVEKATAVTVSSSSVVSLSQVQRRPPRFLSLCLKPVRTFEASRPSNRSSGLLPSLEPLPSVKFLPEPEEDALSELRGVKVFTPIAPSDASIATA